VSSTRSPKVRAAGGVVVRAHNGAVEVLLVHRPRYDDWTLPKGKVDEGETDEDAARREVLEETGLRCRLERALDTAPRYVDNRGRSKIVHYWRMAVIDGEFVPNDEVDAIRWCSTEVAASLLTYHHDVAVLLEASAEH
jgi:8-oxo-dGTP pyrophosphatase MutT (NUDIX family)